MGTPEEKKKFEQFDLDVLGSRTRILFFKDEVHRNLRTASMRRLTTIRRELVESNC